MRRLNAFLFAAALLAWLGGCAGSSTEVAQVALPDPALHGRGALETLAAPDGVDAALWDELKSALRASLADAVSQTADAPGKAIAAVKPPTQAAHRVTDFAVELIGGAQARLSWTYRNPGDYDLNGIVGVTDLAPLGRHFGAREGDPDWAQARVADGDGNGEVNIADVAAIGAGLLTWMHGYIVFDRDQDPWSSNYLETEVTRLSLAAGQLVDGKLSFELILPAAGGTVFLIVPYQQWKPDDASKVYVGPESALAAVPFAPGGWPQYGHDAQHTFRSQTLLGPNSDEHAFSFAPHYFWFDAEQFAEAPDGQVHFLSSGRLYRADETELEQIWLSWWEGQLDSYAIFDTGAYAGVRVHDATIELGTFTESSEFVRALTLTGSTVTRLIIGGDGWAYLAASDAAANTFAIVRLSADGQVEQVAEDSGTTLTEPLRTSRGSLLLPVTEGGVTLREYDLSGNLIAESSPLPQGYGVSAVAELDGRFYVVADERLHVFDSVLELEGSLYLDGSSGSFDNKVVVDGGLVYARTMRNGPLTAAAPDGTKLFELAQADPLDLYGSFGFAARGGVSAVSRSYGELGMHGANGAEQWVYRSVANFGEPFITSDGRVFASGGDGDLHILDSDGSLLKRHRLGFTSQYFLGAATASDGSVFVAGSGIMYALRPDLEPYFAPVHNTEGLAGLALDHSGLLLLPRRGGDTTLLEPRDPAPLSLPHGPVWSADTDSGNCLGAPTVLADGTLILPTCGSLHALRASGELLWSYDAGDAEFSALPCASADESLIFGADSRDRVFALHANNGSLAWETPAAAGSGFGQQLSCIEGRLFIASNTGFTDGRLRILDLAGAEVFTQTYAGNVSGAAWAGEGEVLLAHGGGSSFGGRLLRLDLSGAVLDETPLTAPSLYPPSVDAGGTAYLAGSDQFFGGRVVAVGREGAEVWSAVIPDAPLLAPVLVEDGLLVLCNGAAHGFGPGW